MRASYGCRVWARTYARASGSGAHRRKLKKLKNPATQECRASLGGPTTDDFHLSVIFRSEAQTLRAHFGFSCRPHTRLTPRSDGRNGRGAINTGGQSSAVSLRCDNSRQA
eukprot:s2375_g13.t1